MDNQVTLIGYYGGDETHCLSAWQSTNLDLDIELPENVQQRINILFQETVKDKKKSPKELLSFLAKHKHHTPFEKSCLHFQVRADIATHIHFIKHRIGVSINSESARYKELEDKWYVPMMWDYAPFGNGLHPNLEKPIERLLVCFGYEPGQKEISDFLYGAEILADSNDPANIIYWADVLNAYSELGHALYHLAIDHLSTTKKGFSLGRKRAKETARYFLPYNKQLDFDVMFNFRSFMHFLSLRNSEDAQEEVREIAQSMLDQVRQIQGNPFKDSLEAFGYGIS